MQRLVIGAGYKRVPQLQSKQRFAYIEQLPSKEAVAWGDDRALEPLPTNVVAASANGEERHEVAVFAHEVTWSPRGSVLFASGRDIHRIDPRRGSSEAIADFGQWDSFRQLSVSADGRELAVLHSVNDGPFHFEGDLFVAPVSTTRACVLALKTGEVRALGCVENPNSLRVCWKQRRAGLRIAGKQIRLIDLDGDSVISSISVTPGWSSRLEPCGVEGCELHREPPLPKEQRSVLNASTFQRHGDQVLFVRNDAELRIASIHSIADSNLILDAGGPRYTLADGLRGRHANVSWSNDGRIVGGTVAAWQRKQKLSKSDEQCVDRTLLANGAPREALHSAAWKAFRASVAGMFRFKATLYRFMVDLERREVVVEPGSWRVAFSPVEDGVKD